MFSIEIHEGTATLTLAGDIDLQTTADLKSEIQQLAGIEVLEINAGSVRYIDSSGIAVLLLARQRCQDYGIELRVPVLSAPVFRVLEVARLDTLLPIGEVVPVEDAVTENFGVPTLDDIDLSPETDLPHSDLREGTFDDALAGDELDAKDDPEAEADPDAAPQIRPGTFR